MSAVGAGLGPGARRRRGLPGVSDHASTTMSQVGRAAKTSNKCNRAPLLTDFTAPICLPACLPALPLPLCLSASLSFFQSLSLSLALLLSPSHPPAHMLAHSLSLSLPLALSKTLAPSIPHSASEPLLRKHQAGCTFVIFQSAAIIECNVVLRRFKSTYVWMSYLKNKNRR